MEAPATLAPATTPPPTPWAAALEPEPAPNPVPEAAPGPSTSGGWGAVFPGMEAKPEVPSAMAPAPPPEVSDERPSRVDAMLSSWAKPAAPEPVAPPMPAFGAEPATPPVVATEPSFGAEPAFGAEPSSGTQPAFGAEPATAPAFGAEPVQAESSVDAFSPPEVSEPAAPEAFDASMLARAFDADAAPPYAPQGYDDRAPHLPELAFGLGAVAPGAGHAYNGDMDAAWEAGSWFFLVKPWVQGARDARAYAEKINEYYAPHPGDGALVRAVRYIVTWYALLLVIVGGVAWGGSVAYRLYTRVPPTPIEHIFAAHDEGTASVARAVEGARTALRKAESEIEPPEPEMSDEERAARLFVRGLEECRGFKFRSCKAHMERVQEIESGHRDAIRLQIWAVGRLNGIQQSIPKLTRTYPTSLADFDETWKPKGAPAPDASPDAPLDTPDANPDLTPDATPDASPDLTP